MRLKQLTYITLLVVGLACSTSQAQAQIINGFGIATGINYGESGGVGSSSEACFGVSKSQFESLEIH